MEYQKVWDEILIHGWRADIDLISLAFRFIDVCNNELYLETKDKRDQIGKVLDYISSLKLKRCRDKKRQDVERRFNIRRNTPVRAFVAARSEHLSRCLRNDKNKPADILAAIDRFEWKAINGGSSAEKQKHKRDAACTKVISARSLTKNHDWGTVK
jgi:hypothetical protein